MTGRRAIALAALVFSSGPPGLAVAAPSPGAIEQAVAALEADHDRAAAAVYVLQEGGDPAAEAIRDAWSSLSWLARKRAIGPLARLAPAHDAAVAALLQAARSEDAELRSHALAALQRAGPRGHQALAELILDTRIGDQAAMALARIDPDAAIDPLLHGITQAGGADRAALRNALAVATERAQGSDRALIAWLRTDPPAPAVASAALGLSVLDVRRDLVAELVDQALPAASDFATLWRLLRSAGRAGPSARIDAWLETQLADSSEWMLREAAVESLAMRGHRDRTRPALRDPYPRVRVRATSALAGDPNTILDRAELARRDVWPMVRAAAVRSLRAEEAAVPVVVAAVDDSMSEVRAAAIETLAGVPQVHGWDRIQRRLEDRAEWPNVTAAAIDYVVAHCRVDAVGSLLAVVRRAAPRSARTEDLNNAAHAIEALRVLGTSESHDAVDQLREAKGIPPTLKMALEHPLAEDERCGMHSR